MAGHERTGKDALHEGEDVTAAGRMVADFWRDVWRMADI